LVAVVLKHEFFPCHVEKAVFTLKQGSIEKKYLGKNMRWSYIIEKILSKIKCMAHNLSYRL
jgi:hypothetical protein